MPAERIYWDSDAFLGLFQEEPGKVDLCKGTLERANDGEVVIFASALTIAEVLWLKGGPRLPATKADIVRKFFRHSYIRVRNVTRAIAEDAQGLVWNNGIKPKDAIHVATALDVEATALETFDEQLLSKSGQIGNPPLIIRKPKPPNQQELPLNE